MANLSPVVEPVPLGLIDTRRLDNPAELGPLPSSVHLTL